MMLSPPVMAAPPAASAAGLSAAFAGTIVSTYPDGRTGRLWLRPDGEFAGQGRRGDRSSGRWRVVGERLCLRQSKPLPIPFSYCTPLPSAAGVKASWTARAPTGEAITVRIAPGRAREPR